MMIQLPVVWLLGGAPISRITTQMEARRLIDRNGIAVPQRVSSQ